MTAVLPRRAWAIAWRSLSAFAGSLLALVPHVLHHVGVLAGAALVTGAAGNAVMGVVGLLLSIPFLTRLYRRFNSWRAPAVALTIFAMMFSLSAFIIGPAISGGSPPSPSGPAGQTPADHSSHPAEWPNFAGSEVMIAVRAGVRG